MTSFRSDITICQVPTSLTPFTARSQDRTNHNNSQKSTGEQSERKQVLNQNAAKHLQHFYVILRVPNRNSILYLKAYTVLQNCRVRVVL